jgi:uncharacterized protein (DUF1684 family)
MTGRFLLPLGASLLLAAASYQSEIEAWRRARESRLKAEDGWLTVAGLFWLHDGINSFGKAADNEIVLPDGPAHAGSFELHAGKVTVTMNGGTRSIANDSDDSVKTGRLTLLVIKRADKFGIRLKDPESANRRNFHGLEYFPADEAYRVTARFVSEPMQTPVLNILAQTELSESPGYAVFQLHGKEYRLRPILEEPGAKELFYIFKDQTSGKETYGAGRYLYSDLPNNGKVILDFNKAYNPPCSFTDFATCPLPPRENHLAVRLEAGEKKYH